MGIDLEGGRSKEKANVVPPVTALSGERIMTVLMLAPLAVIFVCNPGRVWPAQEKGGSLSELRLDVTIQPEAPVLGEPILVTFTISNTTGSPVPISSPLFNPSSGCYQLLVGADAAGPYEANFTYGQTIYAASGSAFERDNQRPSQVLKPGGTIRLQDLLVPMGNLYPFRRAGTYYLKYEYKQRTSTGDDWEKLACVTPAKVDIKEPNEGSKSFSSLMLNPQSDYLKFGIFGRLATPENYQRVAKMTDDDIRNELKDLISKTFHPQCAQFVRYLLARSYSDPKDARIAYEEILGKEDFPLRAHAYIELANCTGLLGDVQGQKSLLDNFDENFPGNTARQCSHRSQWLKYK